MNTAPPLPRLTPSRELSQWATQMQAQLQSDLQPERVEVIDESQEHIGHAGANGLGHGTHFRVRIQSASFLRLSRVARHRLVYDSLQAFVDAGVHALAIEVLL